ncbi:MAG TPA: hypothetical protein PKV67_04740 [Hyphomonas sp.]|nr:hypothetical protein [Hyphomonas sp.]HRJ00060.1 hypothetical protein [Hyphomonas sp.]HRK67955.1 hypothetical protein [Hyphomonas sp.]
MTNDGEGLLEPVPTLSEAIEIAIPHMRALAAPLSATGADSDSMVEAFVESVLFGAVWIRPPYRPIDMADAFRDDVVASHGEVEIFTDVVDGPGGRTRKVGLKFGDYAQFVRTTFWEGQG